MSVLTTIIERFFILVIASIGVFVLLDLLPGDPAVIMLGLHATPQAIASLHQQLGLDAPSLTRYIRWIGGLVHGDAGLSYTYQTSVASLIRERLGCTIPVILLATFLSLLIGVPAGVFAATARGRRLDFILMSALQILKSIPDFWLAMMLTLAFSLSLHWFPSGGFPGWGQGLWGGLRSLFLPALALALPQAAITARFTRSSLIDVLSLDFMQTARAQGYGNGAVLWHVAIPNAIIPVVTLVGIQLPLLVTGAIIVESVFGLPGCGKLLLEAVNQRDVPVVQALVMVIVTGVLMLDFVLNSFVRWLDPRLDQDR